MEIGWDQLVRSQNPNKIVSIGGAINNAVNLMRDTRTSKEIEKLIKIMRIALTGTHRVGKTTLAEEIAHTLPDYDFKCEPYLQLEETGYLFMEIPTLDDYIVQFNYSVKQIENSQHNVIFDRCPLDMLAYIQAISKTKNIEALYDEMTNAMSQIDLLVFVQIETPDVIVCRDSDLPKLRHDVNAILQNWIRDLSNEILEVNGTIENRKMQILEKIRKKRNRKL